MATCAITVSGRCGRMSATLSPRATPSAASALERRFACCCRSQNVYAAVSPDSSSQYDAVDRLRRDEREPFPRLIFARRQHQRLHARVAFGFLECKEQRDEAAAAADALFAVDQIFGLRAAALLDKIDAGDRARDDPHPDLGTLGGLAPHATDDAERPL